MIEPRRDPRAELFDHVMREHYGVTDPEMEDPRLLQRTAQMVADNIKALDHVGQAYLRREMRETTVKHEFEYDPSAELYRRG